jgi:S-methylmethionine-dependent homocysteine/selenocysteine methylase
MISPTRGRRSVPDPAAAPDSFEAQVANSGPLLTEGAVAERLKSEARAELDPFLNHAGLIYDRPLLLAGIYRQYVNIARRHDIPMMLMTPTRRVNFETIPRSKYPGRDLIADAARFLNGIRSESGPFSRKIYLGGLLGCQGDAYRADGALGFSDAYAFHRLQVARFMRENLDFLFAGIMPAVDEAAGLAKAMAESGRPYIISFMIRKDGRLLDGTGIAEAIRRIDEETDPRPVGYMANCVHPLNLRLALENEINARAPQLRRFLGLQANASSRSPEELDRCGVLHQDDFDGMVKEMIFLKNHYGFKILGGCCGTNDVFIDKLARALRNELE